MGKSRTAEGGQNPIEPGALAKPIDVGPNMQNFEANARLLVERGGALQVPGEEQLAAAFTKILADPIAATRMGTNAQAVVKENLGAIERTVDMILEHLPHHAKRPIEPSVPAEV